ncbi:uncharacterized protein LOC125585774 [Brassica napus]|uniref:uncharacterized protein LOC125585774 n=1 Tax=Brassica napus TaxID=3708 RepID=UPI00207A36BC|nr:uncharacterized protein LOC125585774 [Brassica napus]
MERLVGCAVTWLRMIQDRDELLDWRDFKMKLKRRFKTTKGGTILSQMLRLRQTGTISEYREQFEELSAEVPHVPNDVLEEIFLHGMKRSMREQVVRLRPAGMDEIVDMATIIEEQENERHSYQSRPFQRTNSALALNSHPRGSNYSPGKQDSGASCSFIATRVVEKLGLPVVATPDFGVAIGDGRIMTSSGKCEGLKLIIQGIEIQGDFMLFDLGATDMVLGYTWLASLGETGINWDLHVMRFQIDGEWVTISSDPALLREQISLSSMEKLCDSEDVVYLLELQTLFENP